MLSLIVSFAFLSFVSSIPIDNGLEGDPEVLCGSQSLLINFNTQAPFEGEVYVKNHFTDDVCKGTSSGSTASIELDFNTRGVIRERSLEPRGVFVSAVVVVKFHPVFLTKIDRAIRIQCFYMEADKTVSQELEVRWAEFGTSSTNQRITVCSQLNCNATLFTITALRVTRSRRNNEQVYGVK